jgi:hypothetical protein
MTYTTGFSLEFALNFARFPLADQLKITAFQTQFESYGFSNFSNYPGKISHSWKGLAPTDAHYAYAKGNDLWHYHIGIPRFMPSISGKYFTSDWLLHFQWPNSHGNGTHIHIVDLLPHNSSSGAFNLPAPQALP